MPPSNEQPLAVTLPPSEYPYQFTELVAFRGDFDESVRPGEVVNPKGIAYHRGLDRLIVSLSPFNTELESRSQILNAVGRDGSRKRFATGYGMYRRVESKIAIVPDDGPPVAAGFIPGEVYLGRGPQTEISRLSAGGSVISDIWVEFGLGGGLWGGLCFDSEGDFGGRLVAMEANGKVYLVDASGDSTMLADLQMRLEGVAIAPVTFGPLARQIIIGVEGYSDEDPHGGKIIAVDKNGNQTLLANIGYAAEDLRFIPPRGGTFYQTQLAFDRERENRIFCAPASQFLNRLGRMTVVNEMTGELWEIAWDGTRFTQQPVGRVPGRWSTAGFYVQGTELESGCFAVKPPRIPKWNDWRPVPGSFRTERSPAAATDALGDVVVFGNNVSDQEIYINSMDKVDEPNLSALSADPDTNRDPDTDRQWSGWRPDPQRIETPHALSCALHNTRMYAFAVDDQGKILHKYYRYDETELSIQTWEDVPGGLLTSTSVASATVNGRLVLSAVGADQQVYLNEMAPGGRYWSGWFNIPGDGHTDVTPAIVSFQDELYIFIKGLTSRRILVKTRTVDGFWLPWAEVPGDGRTDAAITAVTSDGQIYLFVKGTDMMPYVNIASETGTWSGWMALPNPGVTDAGLAATASENKVFVFAKGIEDKQLYVRTTM